MVEHDAPWGRSLIAVSTLATVLCVGIAAWLLAAAPGAPSWAAGLPLAVVIGAALFTVRGYAIRADALGIRRLFWETRLPLRDLREVRHLPKAMDGSVRTFGNGGLFSFTGRYRNRQLGPYRAFVTDPERTVVLTFGERTVVVSPADPARFVAEVGSLCAATIRAGTARGQPGRRDAATAPRV